MKGISTLAKRQGILVGLLLGGIATATALAENNTDYIYNGTTTNFGGVLYIPFTSPGTNNSLQILNGGSVTNAGGALGLNSGDHHNYAIVSDSGSTWYNSGNYSIGSGGSHNWLLLTNTGQATVGGQLYVGSTGSQSNRVIVTDSGSVLTILGYFYPGYAGIASQIIVTNGGVIRSPGATFGAFAGSSNTSFLVTGAGSLWSNSAPIYFGVAGSSGGNSLTIANSGRVVTTQGSLGYDSTSPNNIVTLTGSGSVWSNTADVSVGASSRSNQLVVSDGGMLYLGTSLGVGVNGASASYNTVLVTGTGSFLRAAGGGSGNITVGAAGQNNQMTVSTVAMARSADFYIGSGNTGASNNVVQITGSGSSLTNTGSAYIGYAGASNRLIIADGGRVDTLGTGYVGYYHNVGNNWRADGNVAEITGSGSEWQVSSALYVGLEGMTNQLSVANGGKAAANVLYIGNSGNNNSLTVSSSGRVEVATTAVIGNNAGGHTSSALITGTGSVLTAGANLTIGSSSRGNELTVSNGGFARGVDVYIGNSLTGASNNTVRVTGAGSLLTNSGTLYIGYAGAGNRLIVSDGGRVQNANAYLGYYHSVGNNWLSDNNRAEVSGSGSVWTVNGTLQAGVNGMSNVVLITDGGTLEANTIITGGGTASTITNRGGIYQFTSASPTITAASGAGSIMMSNATISYRGVASADIHNAQVGNIAKQGENTFQLDNSTNVNVASYTFNTGNPSNYYRLALKNGNRFQATTTTFGSGGVLIGNGTVASANVTNHGTIAPGFSAGEITFTSNLVLGATSQLLMEIGGANPSDYDRLIVNGSLTLTGTLSVAMLNAFSPTVGTTFTLIDNTGADPVAGYFTGLTNNAFIDASGNGSEAFFRIQYDGGTGNDVILIATIPEPSILCLLRVGVFFLRRRRNG